MRDAYEEGLVDKLVPGYDLNRFRKLRRDTYGDVGDAFYGDSEKPKFKFSRQDGGGGGGGGGPGVA